MLLLINEVVDSFFGLESNLLGIRYTPYSVLSKFVGQSDIFSKCPTKNVSVPDQMSDKNFPTQKKIIELGNS